MLLRGSTVEPRDSGQDRAVRVLLLSHLCCVSFLVAAAAAAAAAADWLESRAAAAVTSIEPLTCPAAAHSSPS